MKDYTLGPVERQFADLIWENEPLSSRELVALAGEALSWKKSTTYTILRRLSERGLFRNENGTVTSCLSREDFLARQSRRYVEDSFGGSLPRFLAAFTAKEKLNGAEVEALRRLIAQSGEEK